MLSAVQSTVACNTYQIIINRYSSVGISVGAVCFCSKTAFISNSNKCEPLTGKYPQLTKYYTKVFLIFVAKEVNHVENIND